MCGNTVLEVEDDLPECLVGGADGSIGDGTINSDFTAFSHNNVLVYSEYTPLEDGTITYAHWPQSSSDGDTQVAGIWTSTGKIIDVSTKVTGDLATQTQKNAAMTPGVCLEDGDTYLIGIIVGDEDANTMALSRTAYNSGDTTWYITMDPDSPTDFDPSQATILQTSRKVVVTMNNSATVM